MQKEAIQKENIQKKSGQRKQSGRATAGTLTAGGAMLSRLRALGVEYIFANAGTDFPPLIESLAEAALDNTPMPQALVIPHEHAAMGMAHGFYLATGKPQAVIAHTNVGLSNCVIGAINAAFDHVPILLFSGRTPVTEHGRFGARAVPIGWGQEMRDQTAMVRELVKWDYELRFPEQAAELMDRALSIAQSTPKGPIYMSLPREVLCEPYPAASLDGPLTMAPARTVPVGSDIAQAAAWLAAAKRPVILNQGGAGSAQGFAALTDLVDTWAIPVVHFWATRVAVPGDHAMYAGFDLEPWISEADVILVLDGISPWMPDVHKPAADCRIIHAGPNPLWSRYPVRNFRSDLSLAGETADTILALADALRRHKKPAGVGKRRALIVERTQAVRKAVAERSKAGQIGVMTKDYVALCVSDATANVSNVAVLTELGCPLAPMTFCEHDRWFQAPHSGGLGWGFTTALGMQLADRDKLVVATMGDGSYMFANPTACHQIAEALELPLLVVILDNEEWGAVRTSVRMLYPDGHAMKANRMPLTSLAPQPDFTQTARASRAWTAKVTEGDKLPGVLAEAIGHIQTKRTQALVHVKVRA
jgi:acetolactate synthase I/II/III large subunit